MALDFPSAPVVGQTYNGYIYDGTKWKASPTSVAPSVVSATPPSNPTVGDMWFNSTDGTMYFYYNDGNTSQWVESRAPITANGYYSPNYIINGGMDIWQRGTSSTANAAFSADRWWIYYNAGTTTFSKETSVVPSGLANALKMSQASANAGMVVYQFVETQNTRLLAGKTVTLSAYIAATASVTVTPEISWSTTVDAGYAASWTTLTPSVSSWGVSSGSTYARFSATYTIPANAQTIKVGVVTNVTVGNSVYLAGVQLEEGVTATAFRRNANSLQGELAACQRYYQRYVSESLYGNVATGWAYTTNIILAFVPLRTIMRKVPTSIEWSGLGIHDNLAAQPGISSITLNSTSSNSSTASIDVNVSSGLTAGKNYFIGGAGILTAYLGFSAEL